MLGNLGSGPRVRAVPLEVTKEGRGPIGRGNDADFIQSATGCSGQVLNKGIWFDSHFQGNYIVVKRMDYEGSGGRRGNKTR